MRGLRGLPGLSIKGDKGDPGINGITTVVTLPGTQGLPGTPGLPGKQGIQGIPGRNGINGINGKDGKDVSPAETASLRALIVQQHTQTRLNSTSQHTVTRVSILSPIMAALAPILAFLQRIYDAIMAVSNAAILALLKVVDNKLGAQVTGGLSKFIETIAKNTYVEKALAVMTFAATLHNALMLSNNLGQTLGGIVNTVLGLILPKGFDGTPLNINELLGKAATELITDAIGADNYTKLTEDWAKANRIYQATTNVFNSLANFSNTIISGLEIIGGTVGKIGNSLRKWGVV